MLDQVQLKDLVVALLALNGAMLVITFVLVYQTVVLRNHATDVEDAVVEVAEQTQDLIVRIENRSRDAETLKADLLTTKQKVLIMAPDISAMRTAMHRIEAVLKTKEAVRKTEPSSLTYWLSKVTTPSIMLAAFVAGIVIS